MPVQVLDIRGLNSEISGMSFIRADIVNPGGQIPAASIESLSCLHALEHFGLGRYGDEVNPWGWRVALKNIMALPAPGGYLYLSVPIGRERVVSNAHRIFNPYTMINELMSLKLISFAAVNDSGDMDEQAHPGDYVHAEYSCGIYEFIKSEAIG